MMLIQWMPRLYRATPLSAGCAATLFSAYLLQPGNPMGVLGVAGIAILHSLPFFVGALLAPVGRQRTGVVTSFLVGVSAGLVVIVGGTVLTESFLVTEMPAGGTLAIVAPLGVAAIAGFLAAAWLTSGRQRTA